MGDLVKLAFYEVVGKFFLCFWIIPASLIFLSYLLFIIVQIIKELKKKHR